MSSPPARGARMGNRRSCRPPSRPEETPVTRISCVREVQRILATRGSIAAEISGNSREQSSWGGLVHLRVVAGVGSRSVVVDVDDPRLRSRGELQLLVHV
ncbi:Os03g0216766 [Oryza sativa Japonica Group]|uniref:Os03g0216766 protein n=1 Tax=Oryza sativa subsp. japonica TaxID=39947 RepID=A0A0P0VUQ5_ORYSJ|nr:hypothetical protein EE612_016137 [Oryza sativa]BAS82980.1 Os03g0216766 [Oryza sativa Japonica Group]